MNWRLKRLLFCFGSGCYMMLATQQLLAALRTGPPVQVVAVSVSEPMIDLSVIDRYRDVDPAAGTFHPFVGSDPFECALCLVPETHPIHRVAPDA